MGTRSLFLVLLMGSLFPLSVSAQCSAPCVPLEGTGFDFDHRFARTLSLARSEPRFWQRVSLGVSAADPFQAPFAINNEVAPWPTTDLWQPRTSIRAEWAVYQDPSPSGVKLSLGYVRGARVPTWLPKQGGAAGIILKVPFTLLDLR